MKTITLRSHVGTDGKLRVDIPTQLSDTELDVTIWLRPVESSERDRQEKFSEWWAKQLATIPKNESHYKEDLRFQYLAERYEL